MIKSVLLVLKHLNFGGTERFAIDLAESLIKKGITVTIVAGDGPYRPYISPKINLYIVPIGRSNGQRQIAEKIILEAAQKHKPQIIHAQCRNSLICCQLARKVLNVPVIGHEHLAYKDNEYEFVVKELSSGADFVLTIAPYIAKKLIDHGFNKSNVKVFLNSIAISDFPKIGKKEHVEARSFYKLKLSDKVILCLSRIVPGKGIDTLVEAFKMVALKIPNAKLVIAGDDEWGSTKTFIKQMIKNYGLERKVLVLPAQFEVRKLHAVADIFCYPPISRGMAVMEAMASGLPIVAKEATNEPTVAIDGVTGLLSKTGDYKELAEKLEHLLLNNNLCKKMGAAARLRIIEKFNLEVMVERMLRVYGQTIRKRQMLHKDWEFYWKYYKPAVYEF